MNQTPSPAAPNAAAPRRGAAGKYLTFRLGGESYGIAVSQVREILQAPAVTPMPQTPDHVRGVINLRGKIVPVISLRRRFGLSGNDDGGRPCILVTQVTLPSGETIPMGMNVDAVEEVVGIRDEEVEAAPRFGGAIQPDYLLGIAKVGGRVKALLDLDRVVAFEEPGAEA